MKNDVMRPDQNNPEPTDVFDWAKRINSAYRKTVEANLELGRLLCHAKRCLGHGQFQKVLLPQLSFEARMVQYYMKIATHPILSNAKYISYLPSPVSVLIELSTVPQTILTHDDEEDELIPWTEERLPRLPDGEYDAVVLSAKRVVQYGRLCAAFRFRLVTMGDYFNTILYGHCNLGPAGRHVRVRLHSKFASWQRAVAAFTGGAPSKVTLKAFQQFWFRVRVGTVTRNAQQQVRHERDHYSSVIDILAVVGKLSELPADGLSKGTPS